MGEAWRAWIPGFDHLAATHDHEVLDPWLADEAAWSFVERSLRTGLGDLRGRPVADVGCGTGEFRRLVEEGARGIGIEPSSGMREAALRKVAGAAVYDGHRAAIPLPDGAVDAGWRACRATPGIAEPDLSPGRRRDPSPGGWTPAAPARRGG